VTIIRDDLVTSAEPEREHFSGSVWMQRPTAPTDSRFRPSLVSFGPASRTNWHRHPQGQLLYVVSGRGRLGTEDGLVLGLRSGDVVLTEAKKQHWHGAAPDSPMVHLSVTLHDSPGVDDTDWGDSVEDGEYDRT
jgi:quercetin dioxygenase-like cupin family protein